MTVNYVGVSLENGGLPQDGFNGYTIPEISANLDGFQNVYSIINDYGGYWLSGGGGTNRGPETANIVLLQIGANDLGGYSSTGSVTADQAAANTAASLEDLINKVIKYEPQAMLLVDGTSPMLNGAFYTTASEDYDADVQSLISSQFQGKDVYYVDMMDAILAGADTPDGHVGGYALYETDGVHLNSLGYGVMAQTWDTAIIDDYVDPVPEPSTYALFAGGALALFTWRRFRRV